QPAEQLQQISKQTAPRRRTGFWTAGNCLHNESETSRASLVRQELELIGQKRPVLSHLIMRPLPLHRQAPSVGENGRAAYREVLRQDRDLGLGTGFKKCREWDSVGTFRQESTSCKTGFNQGLGRDELKCRRHLGMRHFS